MDIVITFIASIIVVISIIIRSSSTTTMCISLVYIITIILPISSWWPSPLSSRTKLTQTDSKSMQLHPTYNNRPTSKIFNANTLFKKKKKKKRGEEEESKTGIVSITTELNVENKSWDIFLWLYVPGGIRTTSHVVVMKQDHTFNRNKSVSYLCRLMDHS